ncbi:hypothetical protein LARI1_G009086 [Lachnellula arida]|uniref:Uncharacterized protein n=1 Tax=Lachnellula arida TaxID=1316785 RepID=A0A8T9B7W5_9HELO|nr:hypothetical protein LARI1_G009086 [Lachnellula arida]
MKFLSLSTLFLLVTGFVDATISPVVCISAPAVTLQPGSIVSARRCADQSSPSCTQAMISGGSGDQNALDISQSGVISCILPIATQTTLVTSIGPSTTVTEALTSTILSTSAPSTSALSTNLVSASTFSISYSSLAPPTTSNAMSGNSAASTSTSTSTPASNANAVSVTSGASSNMVIGNPATASVSSATNLVPTAMGTIMTTLSQASAIMTERQLSWRITETITALCTSS